MFQHRCKILWSVVAFVLTATAAAAVQATPVPLPDLAWERVYPSEDNEIPGDLIQTTDGGYLALAVKDDPTTFLMDHDVYLAWFNASGELVRDRTYPGPGLDVGMKLISVSGNGYLVVGTRSYPAVEGSIPEAHLLRLTAEGEVLWESTASGPDPMIAADAVVTASGFLIAGAAQLSGSGKLSSPWLLEVNADGVLEGQHTYPMPDRSRVVNGIQATPDGGYLLGGVSEDTWGTWGDVYLLKLRQDFSVEWELEYDAGNFDQAWAAYPVAGDRYLVIGESTRGTQDGFRQALAIVVSDTGQVESTATYRPKNWTSVRGVCRSLDGNFILSCQTYDQPYTNERSIALLKLTPQGELLGQQFYQRDPDEVDEVRGVMQDLGSSYVVYGARRPPKESQLDLWLLKTLPELPSFIRSDANRDGAVDISDPIHTLSFLFLGGTEMPCRDAADANDDGEVDISDGVYTLSYLFNGGPQPPPPHGSPGVDLSPDNLDCNG